MGRSQTIVKNTMILTIGKVCTQLITFFLLPLYTAILTTTEYGAVDLLNTLVSLLLPIVTFQVEQALFRALIDVRQNDIEKRIIISTGLFSVLGQCTIYLLLFSIIYPFINNDYKIFLAINVVAYIFASIFQQVARGLGDNKRYAVASFLTASSTIVFNILFLVVARLGANGMLLANMLAQIVCTIYLISTLKLKKYISYKYFDNSILKKLWTYSLPLVPNAISWWVFNTSDRVIVSGILGIAKNGILSAAHKFSGIYITFYNIFNLSWTEMVVMHINDEDIEVFFNKMFNTALKFFVSMGIGIIACMPFIFPIMINIKFQEAYFQIPIMILGSIFNVVVGLSSAIYVAKKDTKAIANTSIISAIINIVVHLILIKLIGLYAAAISTLIAFLIMSIYRINDINKKYIKIHIEKSMVVSSILIFTIIIIPYYMKSMYLSIFALVLTIIYAWFMNRNSVELLITFIKDKRKK